MCDDVGSETKIKVLLQIDKTTETIRQCRQTVFSLSLSLMSGQVYLTVDVALVSFLSLSVLYH